MASTTTHKTQVVAWTGCDETDVSALDDILHECGIRIGDTRAAELRSHYQEAFFVLKMERASGGTR